MSKETSPGRGKRAARDPAKAKAEASTHPVSAAGRPVRGAGDLRFPIVGIGASAGGLEALEQFFSQVPASSGMAFVVVQHMDPNQKGLLPELLQRCTPMPVSVATDRQPVRPDSVYVIPPNKDLSLLRGTLHLFEPSAAHGLRLPIDFFMNSLAEDLGHLSVAVILSGMGTDGTLGVRAIKEHAGLVMVQDPESARFDSMPRSVIEHGLADVVGRADELPARLAAIIDHGRDHQMEPYGAPEQSALEKVVLLLRSRTGHDFSMYKKSTLHRRIERRMGIHQLDRMGDYVRYLRENPQELDLLFRELLIGVTNFFRDPAAWTVVLEKVFPALFEAHPDGKALRAWVPACSTGEEAYSLAICFREALERAKPPARFTLHVFATDLHEEAVNRARMGLFPQNIVADVSAERLSRFFTEEGGGFRINKEIRDLVTFAPQDVIIDPPFTKLDILCCRNLMIYFDQELQSKLIPLFHYSLNPAGYLFLGSAETVGSFTDLFAQLDPRSRVYRRLAANSGYPAVDFPSRFPVPAANAGRRQPMVPAATLQSAADQILLQRFSPAAVLVNALGDILYISGRTGKYLEPAAGKANWNVHAMARRGLRNELSGALARAVRTKGSATTDRVPIDDDADGAAVTLGAHYLEEAGPLQGLVMLVFTDAAPLVRPKSSRTGRNARVAELEQALQEALSENLANREEMQTSQEELKSSYEELQSTNEELQSTNEELTTSKEEMQSMNEELQMVNQELQARVDDLAWASNDMENLLNSTDIATIFLNNTLNIRRFTRRAQRIFKLLPGDTGRPLSDISTDLVYPELQNDARHVLRTLMFSEKQIPTRDGHWFSVRIMPYRTMDNAIDGVVITFWDISTSKDLEARLRKELTGGDHADG